MSSRTGAPVANSLVPPVNVFVINERDEALVVRRTDSDDGTPRHPYTPDLFEPAAMCAAGWMSPLG